MGIPFLYQALIQRYPSLSATVTANQLPEYDYFYIDLNFLIHKAVDEKCRLPMEQVDAQFYDELRIFERILRWIETMHRLIRPQKLFFLTVDGVAPRAKWDTQRERRCQNDDGPFDKNSISPGTVFMKNFETILNNFVANKIKFDRDWQNCEVLVSGPNCPGEGSIKIIEHIRSLKTSTNYDENATHCIYSGDNDFIQLGLAVHERYISFLQESKKTTCRLGVLCSNDIKHEFTVIHFKLLREYLEMEFICCKNQMKFEFDLNRIADDWVLICMLMGNDYIPNVPHFDLRSGALSVIHDAYKEALLVLRGYINENGCLDMERFIQFVGILQKKDFELFKQKKSVASITDELNEINLSGTKEMMNTQPNDFKKMKDRFYAKYSYDNQNLRDMTTTYIKTIQWILFYYYRSSCSWSFYYPYEIAPFISDFSYKSNPVVMFDVDKPIEPFEHLLAILPKSSVDLLPKYYQRIVNKDFSIRIPMMSGSLTAEERQRNTVGLMKSFRFEKQGKNIKDWVQIREVTPGSEKTAIAGKAHKSLETQKSKFSSLKLHLVSGKLDRTDDERLIINLDRKSSNDLDLMANEYLKKIVYIYWPHSLEAKVIGIMNASSARWADDRTKPKTNLFDLHYELLKNRYNRAGIDVGDINIIALVAPLICSEYKPINNNDDHLKLVKQWDKEFLRPFPIQTLLKYSEPSSNTKSVVDVINDLYTEDGPPNVFLIGNNTRYYGEMVSIVDTKNLSSNGRVHILGYIDKEPDFTKIKEIHSAMKSAINSGYKQLSNVAALLGINNRVLSVITGHCLVFMTERSETPVENVKKINIGLQLKCRKTMMMLHSYVKNTGNTWIFSQKAIDLIKNYMNEFPRVFELLNNEEKIYVSDFNDDDNNGGMDYVSSVFEWLTKQPHQKESKKSANLIKLSAEAICEVKQAVEEAYPLDADTVKLQVKWQNVLIPDLNELSVIHQPDAVYKLLDRVIIIRSGYPMPVGSKGTVISIEPNQTFQMDNLTASEIFAMEILMDYPYKISLPGYNFDRHYIFRTRSPNMLINISHR